MKRRSAIKNISLGMGVAISGVGLSSLISGCKTDQSTTWTPAFMDADQHSVMEIITDLLLPTTETPGASDLGLVKIMDNIIDKLYKQKEKDSFHKGMQLLRSRFDAKNPDAFMKRYYGSRPDKEIEQKDKFLDLDVEDSIGNESDEYHFEHTLNAIKSMAINSYFKHPTIAMEHLDYDPIPGEYSGCIPLSDTAGLNYSL